MNFAVSVSHTRMMLNLWCFRADRLKKLSPSSNGYTKHFSVTLSSAVTTTGVASLAYHLWNALLPGISSRGASMSNGELTPLMAYVCQQPLTGYLTLGLFHFRTI